MKKYIRSANKLSNAITQKIAEKKFSENEILVRALAGEHRGEPMMYVFFNIMLDPNVQIENPQQLEGNHTIFYNGKNIGWINFERGMGWIDDRAYDKIQKLDPAVLDQLINNWMAMMMGLPGQPDVEPNFGLGLDDGRTMYDPGYFDDMGGADFGDDDSQYWS